MIQIKTTEIHQMSHPSSIYHHIFSSPPPQDLTVEGCQSWSIENQSINSTCTLAGNNHTITAPSPLLQLSLNFLSFQMAVMLCNYYTHLANIYIYILTHICSRAIAGCHGSCYNRFYARRNLHLNML